MSRYLELAAEPTAWQRFRAWPLGRIVATVYGTLVAAAVVTAYLCSVLGLAAQGSRRHGPRVR